MNCPGNIANLRQRLGHGPGPRVHLLSFGTGRYKPAAQRMTREAYSTGLFDAVHVYDEIPPSVGEDPRWKSHMAARRGAGFWFWKSVFALKILREHMVYGDVLVYVDAGCRLGNSSAWASLFELLCEHDIVAFGLSVASQKYTKGDLFERFKIELSQEPYCSDQTLATYWLMRKTNATLTFLSFWEELASDFHLISDEASLAPNHPSFVDHRHDQSIFDFLVKASDPEYSRTKFKGKVWPLHPEFGINGLRPVVLQDIGYPPNPLHFPISASRHAGCESDGKSPTDCGVCEDVRAPLFCL